MNRSVNNLLEKLARNKHASPLALAQKAVRFAGDATRARLFLADCDHVGTGARIVGRPHVDNKGRIEIGDDFKLTSRWSSIELAAGPGGVLTIGNGVEMNYGTLVSAQKRVTIGDRVMIGNYCIVADTEVPGTDGRGAVAEPDPIEIGDDVWLAVRVTVLPGAKIGAGAVVTAGSVVAGTIPPGVVAGGIPARVLRATVTQDDKNEAKANGHANAANGARASNGANGAASAIAKGGKGAPDVVPEPAPRVATHRGLLVSDFTIDELAHQLRRISEAPVVDVEVAPFGQIVQSLMMPPPKNASDFAVVWTRAETTIPAFASLLANEKVSREDILSEVDAFCDMVVKSAANFRYVFVPTWTQPSYNRGLGLLDGREGGAMHALALMNVRLMEKLGAASNVHVLNAQRWAEVSGKNAHSPKAWYLGKVAFHADVFAEAAREIHAGIRAMSGMARKLLVLDLDDTMWGGIVGDVGWENLRLGGHDGTGESFVDFQRAVKALTKRGVVLGIVSKNEESVALEAIKSHPEMVLREDDFVGWRINWKDKAQNILDLVTELNLGLQSVVFIDDNPVERARVRSQLPEVLVPEWPEDKLLYKSAFTSLRCFDAPPLTKEDAERTQLYAAERKREQLQKQVGSMDEWLASLEIKVRAEPLAPHNLQRTAQLLNKTNQMNLSTRRLTDAELMEWASLPGHRLWAVNVSDKLGDAGLTGIVSVAVEGGKAKIVDFVLSCRVMGRKVEDTMVHVAVEHARSLGATEIEAPLLPTAKNKPCLTFWQGSGFTSLTGPRGETSFTWDPSTSYARPPMIALEWIR